MSKATADTADSPIEAVGLPPAAMPKHALQDYRWPRCSVPAAIIGVGLPLYALVCFWVTWFRVGDEAATAKANEQVDKTAYVVVASAFISALAMNMLTFLFEPSSTRRQLALLACYINLVAGSSHVLSLFGLSPMAVTFGGATVNLHRQAMWLFTTPVMVYMISTISSMSQTKVYQVMAADFFMIVIGINGQLSTSPTFAALGMGTLFVTYIWVQMQMWSMFDAPLELAEDQSTKRMLRVLRFWTVTTWTYFPMVWVLVHTGMVSVAGEEWLWALGDIIAKIVFSSSLLHGNFLTIEQRRAATMRIVEEANRAKQIDDLHQMVNQKDRFLSSMSHELRTPLNGIIGLSDAMLVGSCGALSDQCTKTISTIKNSGLRLLNLINDILDSATMKKGQLVVKHEKVQLNNVLDDVVELCEPLARRGVVLRHTVNSSLPAIIGDTSRMIQIFYNLIGNACKFTHQGEIVISAEVVQECMEISVSDSGIGVPKDKFSTIFNEFEQVDMSTTRKYGGTGLGLALVKQIVDAHEGTITLTSELGKGTTFIIRLKLWGDKDTSVHQDPQHELRLRAATAVKSQAKQAGSSSEPAKGAAEELETSADKGAAPKKNQTRPSSKTLGVVKLPAVDRPAAQPAPAPHPSATTEGTETHTKKPSWSVVNDGKLQVLSVDDDPTNQLVIQNLLEPIGYQVEQAMDGEIALEFLEKSDTMPDIILLDVRMPGMSGYEVCRKLRSLYHDYFLPVIMVSAQTSEEEIVQGLLSGANDYVTKPFGRQALLARINSHLKVKAFVDTGPSTSQSVLDNFASCAQKKSLSKALVVNEAKKQAEKADSQKKKKTRGRLLTPAAILATTTRRTIPQAFAERIVSKDCPQGPHIEELPMISVVVAQLDNLSELSEAVDSADFIAALAEFTLHVEFLLENYGLYMFEDSEQRLVVAAGMNGEQDHVQNAMEFGKSLLRAASTVKLPEELDLQLTIGMHSASAVGFVTGLHKPVLSLAGPVVHQAGVLQHTCPTNCIHISTEYKSLLKGAEDALQVTEHSYLVREGAFENARTDKMGVSLTKALAQPWQRIPAAATPLQQALIALAMAKPNALWDAVNVQGSGEEDLRKQQAARVALEKQLEEVSGEADRLQDNVDALEEELAITKKALEEELAATKKALEEEVAAAKRARADAAAAKAATPRSPSENNFRHASETLLANSPTNQRITPSSGSTTPRGSSMGVSRQPSETNMPRPGEAVAAGGLSLSAYKVAKLEAELEVMRADKVALEHTIRHTLQQMAPDRQQEAQPLSEGNKSNQSLMSVEECGLIDATITVLGDVDSPPLMNFHPMEPALQRANTMPADSSLPPMMGLLNMVGLGHLHDRFQAEGITAELLPLIAADDDTMKRCGITQAGDRLRLRLATWAQAKISSGNGSRRGSFTTSPKHQSSPDVA